MIGIGHVGDALLRQVSSLSSAPLRLVGAATTRASAYRSSGLLPDALAVDLREQGPLSTSDLVHQLVAHPAPLAVVDATGSPEILPIYEPLLRAGVHVVTPSKLACSASQAGFYRLRQLGDGAPVHFRYETTVGAGLPVVRTLQEIVASGDRVRSIRAVLSGTLTYLFHEVESGRGLAEAVAEAVAGGYAEPDPRDDLGGEDVVRKALILARTAGLSVERAEVQVRPLVSEALRALPREALGDALISEGAAWASRAREAEQKGQRVRYLATITADGGRARITVGPESVPASSPFGLLGGTDNLIEITTDRYAASPLRIQGPGAGPDVTAAGVLAELLDVASRLSRPALAAAA